MGTELLERAAAAADVPEEFRWVLSLSTGNFRAFRAAITTARNSHLSDAAVVQLLEDWRATAELDAAPEVQAEIRRPKKHEPLSTFVRT